MQGGNMAVERCGGGGLLLLTGKILLIKKKTSLVSVSEGFLLCGMDAG